MGAPKGPLSSLCPLIFVRIFSRFCVFSNLPGPPYAPGPVTKLRVLPPVTAPDNGCLKKLIQLLCTQRNGADHGVNICCNVAH